MNEIKRVFKMLIRQFFKAFLSQRPQNAPPFLPSALPNPPILLSDYPGTEPGYLTFQKSCLISCSDTLTPAFMTPDTRFAQVPPILHANHPILLSNHPILLSNHPIQRGNHPRFPASGPRSWRGTGIPPSRRT